MTTTLRALLVGLMLAPTVTAATSPPPGGAGRAVPHTVRPLKLAARPPLAGPRKPPPPAKAELPRVTIRSTNPPAILPLSEVRAGMVGEALTVFQGTRPEPFKVRVVSVMHHFLPKQDVILIRAEDPRVQFSGIVAGMSGSPVYVGGRLMGAIAYGWSFSKEPLGGVTPIETMLAERARPHRTSPELSIETDGAGLRNLTLAEGGPGSSWGSPTGPGHGRDRSLGSGAGQGSTGDGNSADDGSARPVAGGGRDDWGGGGVAAMARPHLVRVAVPLSVSGFDPRVLGDLGREFQVEGLVPVQGAGVGRPRGRASGTGRLEPGSAVGIELIRGDMSMVGTGTVTYVDHDGVLAFGHPMFGAGEIYLPLVEAEVHAILPSLSQSMKLSSPLREVGALVQDRQSCVVGDLGARATMMPVTVRVRGTGAGPRTFRAEVARNRRLTPTLAALVLSNALVDAEPDVAEMVVKVVSTIGIKGRKPLELRDEVFAAEGVSRQSLTSTRGLRAVAELLSNPFEPVILERLDVELQIDYGRDVAEIVGLSLGENEIHPGETIALRVSLRPYHGREYTETIPVVIPRNLTGDSARIEVAAGSVARPDTPAAESLADHLENLRRYFPPAAMVVGIQTPDDGVALHGRLLADLPAAAMDTLRPAHQTRRAEAFRVVARSIHQTKRLLFGRQELTVQLRDDVLGRLNAGAARH